MAEINKKREFATPDFAGVNTQALRLAIKPNEQSWLENIQPIGPGNARTVPNISTAILQLPTRGASQPQVYYAQGFNVIINGSPADILMVADTLGDIWAINVNTNSLTYISRGGAYQGQFANASFAQWKNERIMIIDSNYGLFDWYPGGVSGVLTYSGAGGSGYTGTNRPSAGQCIATFSGRVWVSNNRTVFYSAPGSYNDWTTNSAAGSFVITDETLHSSVQQMVASSNFLYIFGVDSCNVISNVVVSGTSTLFTNTNLSTGVGTPFPMSTTTYGRSIWFASVTGFYAMYGASARKESTPLDGMFGNIQNLYSPAAVGAVPTISAGLVSINNILCIAFLFQYNDSLFTTQTVQRPLMALYFDGKWFFASQGATSGQTAPTIIADALVGGKNNLYAFDSSGIMYQLFSTRSTSVTWRFQTALWDFDQQIMYKQLTKAGLGAYFNGASTGITLYTDNESQSGIFAAGGTQTYSLLTSSGLTFTGAGGVPISFVGTGPITWASGGYNLMQTDVTNWGRYIGFTLQGNTTDMTLTMIAAEYNYRSQWGS